MSVEKNKRDALLSWVFIVLLVGMCATLGVLQYRQIGDLSRAEHERLKGSLQVSLRRLSEDFNTEISSASTALAAPFSSDETSDTEREYATRYATWRASGRHAGLDRRLALVVPGESSLSLRLYDPDKATFVDAEWPAEWAALRDRFTARAFGDPSARMRTFGVREPDVATVIDIPHFTFPGNRDRPNTLHEGPPQPRRE